MKKPLLKLKKLTAGLAAWAILFTCLQMPLAELTQTAINLTAAAEDSSDNKKEDSTGANSGYSSQYAATALNLLTGTRIFGVSVPVHNLAFAAYDKYIGIDVSKWNGDIDWQKVKAAGIEYAIIRVGYRGYGSEGTLVLDSKFKENIEGALKNDIKVGVYFFTQAINTAEAIAEADFTVKQLAGYEISLPVIIDIEDATDSSGAVTGRVHDAKLNKEQYTSICSAFCDRVKEAGYQPMVYANSYWLTNNLDAETLESKYGIWLANYTSQTAYGGKYQVWQYSSKGSVSGISGSTDLNIFYMLPPQTPQNLKVTPNPDLASYTVSWDKTEGAEGYVIYAASLVEESLVYSEIADTTECSFTTTDSGIVGFAVSSYKMENGQRRLSEMSDEVSVFSTTSAPTGLTFVRYASASAAISWNPTEGATGYKVYVKKAEESAYALAYETSETSLSVKNLTAASLYDIKVCAVFENGQSPFTPALRVVTSPAVVKNPAADTSSAVTKLSWEKSEGADRYIVYAKKAGESAYKIVKRTSETSAELTSLAAAQSYTIIVKGVKDTEEKSYYSGNSQEINIVTKPKKVPSLSSYCYTTSVKLKWKSAGENVTYRVCIYNESKKTYELIDTTTELSYKITGLTKDTKYRFAVNAVNENGVRGGHTTSGYVYTAVDVPKNLKSTTSTSSIKITWNKVAGAEGYIVYLKNANGSYSKYTTVNTNSVTIKNIAAGKAFTFKVKAYKKLDGKNRYGVASGAYSVATNPQAVKNVVFDHSAAKVDSVTLSWNKVSNCTGYLVYLYDSSSKKYTRIAKVNTNSATLALDSGRNYTFKVRAYTSAGSKTYYGGYSAAVEAFTRCAAPTNIKVATYNSKSLTLKWDAVAGAQRYELYRVNANGTYSLIASTTATKYKVSSLTRATTYKFVMRTVKTWKSAVWYSDYSPVFSASTPPPITENVSYSTSTHNTVTLKWSKVSEADGYRVYSYDSRTNKYTRLRDVTGTSAKITGLAPNSEYTFAVKAYIKEGSMKYFSGISAKVNGKTAPAAPTNVVATSITQNAVSFSWDASAGAEGYRIYLFDYEQNKYVIIDEVTELSYTLDGFEPEEVCAVAVKPYLSYGGKNRYCSTSGKLKVTTAAAVVEVTPETEQTETELPETEQTVNNEQVTNDN